MDGQPKPCWAVPAILATALIYDEEATDKTIALLSKYQGDLEKMALEAAKNGVNAFPELCNELFQIALNVRNYHVDGELLEYCERFHRHFTSQSKNPADELLGINNGLIFAAEQYRSYEKNLFDIIQPPKYVAAVEAEDLAVGCQC
jgi:hypothetical protein